jgi:hypothetical protein
MFSWDSVGVCQVISGTILVVSVYRIKRFFDKRNAQDYINTGMLARHAVAFGLYLTTTLAFFISYQVYTLHPTNAAIYNVNQWTCIFFNVGSFTSQLLLCNIFWELGGKVEQRM